MSGSTEPAASGGAVSGEEGLTVRPMAPGDLDAVAAIERASLPSPWPRRLFEEELGRKISRSLVVERQGRVVGYLVWWAAPGEAHIVNLAVAPEARRKGAARALLSRLYGAARAEGAKLATLEVRAGNGEALRLYESEGFRLVAVRRRYYADDGSDAYVMLKEL